MKLKLQCLRTTRGFDIQGNADGSHANLIKLSSGQNKRVLDAGTVLGLSVD